MKILSHQGTHKLAVTAHNCVKALIIDTANLWPRNKSTSKSDCRKPDKESQKMCSTTQGCEDSNHSVVLLYESQDKCRCDSCSKTSQSLRDAAREGDVSCVMAVGGGGACVSATNVPMVVGGQPPNDLTPTWSDRPESSSHVHHHHYHHHSGRHPHPLSYTSNSHLSAFNQQGTTQDLKRFLDVVGSEPKEARYWLKYFQKKADYNPLFAVIEIDEEVIQMSELLHKCDADGHNLDAQSPLDQLCNYLAFLQRHDMKCVLVHGRSVPPGGASQTVLDQLQQDSQLITDLLEKHGAPVRQAVPSVVQGALGTAGVWGVGKVDPRYIEWAMSSGHIPLVPNLALTPAHQLVPVELPHTTAAIARELLPLKVLLVNMTGGYSDDAGRVVANINMPHDEPTVYSSEWCTEAVRGRVHYIKSLLTDLHRKQEALGMTPDSAVVVTSATSLLTELFTHHGSGTFFKITEKINHFRDLNDVDINRLADLIQMSFGRDLKEGYFDQLTQKLDGVFISEDYGAAAIITRELGVGVPYLDKLVVRKDHQDNCVGRMLWDHIHTAYPQLFWRSRNTNLINPWYFKKSEGSWNNGKWTVFWYGVSQPSHTAQLIEYALALPNTFTQPTTQQYRN